ncbi:MAG: hypothetical protein WC616_02400 [Candidatus Omnitrophota bacterium]
MPTFKMNMPDTSKLTLERKVEALENTLTELITRISWQQSKLDSTNVKRIDTNQTVVKSANGETVITGPILEMYDSAAVLRLKQGYNSATDTFLFALNNAAGDQTVGIDSSGNIVVTGDITGSMFNTLQTGDINYIQIDDTGFNGYEKIGSAYELNGLVISSVSWANTYFYYRGDKYFGIEFQPIGVSLKNYDALGNDYEFLFSASDVTYPNGTWDFSGAAVVNTISEANHNHGGSTGNAGDGITMPIHNHSISSGGGHDGHLA